MKILEIKISTNYVPLTRTGATTRLNLGKAGKRRCTDISAYNIFNQEFMLQIHLHLGDFAALLYKAIYNHYFRGRHLAQGHLDTQD